MQELLGHAWVTTTQRYAHLEVEDLQAQVADLPLTAIDEGRFAAYDTRGSRPILHRGWDTIGVPHFLVAGRVMASSPSREERE